MVIIKYCSYSLCCAVYSQSIFNTYLFEHLNSLPWSCPTSPLVTTSLFSLSVICFFFVVFTRLLYFVRFHVYMIQCGICLSLSDILFIITPSKSTCAFMLSCSVMSKFLQHSAKLACQDSLSIKFSRQEYWSGLPFPFQLSPSIQLQMAKKKKKKKRKENHIIFCG